MSAGLSGCPSVCSLSSRPLSFLPLNAVCMLACLSMLSFCLSVCLSLFLYLPVFALSISTLCYSSPCLLAWTSRRLHVCVSACLPVCPYLCLSVCEHSSLACGKFIQRLEVIYFHVALGSFSLQFIVALVVVLCAFSKSSASN